MLKNMAGAPGGDGVWVDAGVQVDDAGAVGVLVDASGSGLLLLLLLLLVVELGSGAGRGVM